MDKFVHVTLEREDERKELSFKLRKVKQKLHCMKELKKYAVHGWQLDPQSIYGNDEYVAAMKRLVDENVRTGKIPIKGLMKETGLRVLPGFLKKTLKLEPDEDDGK